VTVGLELPVRDSTSTVDVCHRAGPGEDPVRAPVVAMCGAVLDEGWECCSNGVSCGRPPCPLCELAMEGPWSG
jgi:hypothetical protein